MENKSYVAKIEYEGQILSKTSNAAEDLWHKTNILYCTKNQVFH